MGVRLTVLLIFCSVSQMAQAQVSDQEIREKTTVAYKKQVSPAFRKFRAMWDGGERGFPACKLAVETSQAGDPYLGAYAWYCFRHNEYPGEVDYMEAVGWLKACHNVYDNECAKYLGDLYSNNFTYIKSNQHIRPDFDKAVQYYADAKRWAYLSDRLTPQNSKWVKDFTQRMKKLKVRKQCDNLETRLFGILIKCATRAEIRQALSRLPVRPVDIGAPDFMDTYDASSLFNHPTSLTIRYSSRDILGYIDYSFILHDNKKEKESKLLESVLMGMVKKYGPSEINGQNRKHVDISRSAEWTLPDGTFISYTPRDDVDITYFGGYDMALYGWERDIEEMESDSARKTKQPAATSKPHKRPKIDPTVY